ncbi:hypothetical protein KUTeg_006701 [Tegillarca granosa]|uniref:Uncharacterized protein n=1 Tax=Tegillarca granosa TaxID=220873 RepID=A0ABQ9FD36_TEGGR|nr:hypothetical protein KUTeg_006701 [Tegillarca granosa]
MLCKQVEATLGRKCLSVIESRIWKITYTAKNCEVCGKLMSFDNLEGYTINPNLLQMLTVDNVQDGQQFASSIYKQMKKCICSYVLYDYTLIGYLKYFVLAVTSNVVYAILDKYEVAHDAAILDLEGGKHIIPVKKIGTEDIRPADKFLETLVYVKTCNEVEDCVVMMPSQHGHAIFK